MRILNKCPEHQRLTEVRLTVIANLEGRTRQFANFQIAHFAMRFQSVKMQISLAAEVKCKCLHKSALPAKSPRVIIENDQQPSTFSSLYLIRTPIAPRTMLFRP